MDRTLEHIHDRSLTAEVHRFRECNIMAAKYAEDIRKIEERMWEAGIMRDASIRRLEAANALGRLDAGPWGNSDSGRQGEQRTQEHWRQAWGL